MKQKHESDKRLLEENNGERNSNSGKHMKWKTILEYLELLLDYLPNKRMHFVSDASVAIDEMLATKHIAKNLLHV